METQKRQLGPVRTAAMSLISLHALIRVLLPGHPGVELTIAGLIILLGVIALVSGIRDGRAVDGHDAR